MVFWGGWSLFASFFYVFEKDPDSCDIFYYEIANFFYV